MSRHWPQIVVAVTSAGLAIFGLLNLVARNWLWGHAGSDTEARQPIMLLGLLALAVGISGIWAALRGSLGEQLLVARILLVMVSLLPIVAGLNLPGWDRVWEATGLSVAWISVGIAVVLGGPLIVATRVLGRRAHR